MCRRSRSGLRPSTLSPSNRTSPRSGSTSRLIVRNSVDFPEPEGPITETVCPFGDVEVHAAQDPVATQCEVQVTGGQTDG
ncbi:hypothetical protein GCM10020229_56930 [Kitasatospora albolonga]